MSVALRVNFCTPKAMAMKIGIITMPTTKAFERVSVLNSDSATIAALFFIGYSVPAWT